MDTTSMSYPGSFTHISCRCNSSTLISTRTLTPPQVEAPNIMDSHKTLLTPLTMRIMILHAHIWSIARKAIHIDIGIRISLFQAITLILGLGNDGMIANQLGLTSITTSLSSACSKITNKVWFFFLVNISKSPFDF